MSLRVLQGEYEIIIYIRLSAHKRAVHNHVVRWQLLGVWRPAVQEVVDLASEYPDADPVTAHGTDQAPKPKPRPSRPRRRGVRWADETSDVPPQHDGSGAAAARADDVIGGGGGGGGDHGAGGSGGDGAAADMAGDAALAAQLAFGSDDDDEAAAADDDVKHSASPLSPARQPFHDPDSRGWWVKHGGVSIAAHRIRQTQYNLDQT